MDYPVNINKVSSGLEYFEEVSECSLRARAFLLAHRWCKEIYDEWLFTNLGSTLCIFLFKIQNLQSPDDDLLWVMAGDFPSIYLDTYSVKSTKEVIQVYVSLAKDWIQAAESGLPLNDCYPFEVPDGKTMVDLFKKKVFLLETIVSEHIEDLSCLMIQSGRT